MTTMQLAAAALLLAAVNLCGLIWLCLLIRRHRELAATALDDARYEFEADVAFLSRRPRARRDLRQKLPPINDKGHRHET